MFDPVTELLIVVGVVIVCGGIGLHEWATSKGRKWR